MIRTYSDLIKMGSFMDRFNYLKLGGKVGRETFGADRFMNQSFYRSTEWKRVRDIVITRDLGLDLGCVGFDILDRMIIHHMNPISPEDIEHSSDILLNPEYLILTSERTHNAIHYGDESLLPAFQLVERRKYDTCPWRH